MNVENLMSMFEKDAYPFQDYIKRYKIIDFENMITKIVTEHKLEMAELEAKVYAYEKIIANSNFAPFLKESKNKKGNLGADK